MSESIASARPDLVLEWHPTKNGDLSPLELLTGSGKKVWWQCAKGHEWQAPPLSRKRSNCPVCSNRIVLPGYNDLASQRSDVAALWHPIKNGELTPYNITSQSGKVVWWKCAEGHEWDGIIRETKHCPYCVGQRVNLGVNDLVTTHPQLASEWHPNKNGTLTPESVSSGSAKKVWWLGKCGHEWLDDVNRRTRRDRRPNCPICMNKRILAGYNDLATTHPHLVSEWHPTLNGTSTPQKVVAGSHKKVWWLGKCGHELEMAIRKKVAGQGCHYCLNMVVLSGFNDLKTTHPQLASEWHPTLNAESSPETVSYGCDSSMWWLGECGHEWKTRVANRSVHTSGCPTCAAKSFISRGEQEIADYLTQELGLSIEQSNRSLLKGTEIDIYVPDKKLAIEYNGLYWHSTARGKSDRRHLEKYEQAQAAGIQLLQIWEDEWQNKPALIKRLLAHKLGESREPLVGARQTSLQEVPLAETRTFLDEYHIQGHSNGSYYLGLRSKTNQTLVAIMVLAKRASQTGLTLEIVRYATSCRVPGGFTKLLKYVETALNPSRLVTFADHCISDGGLYAQNGFTAEKELKPDYRYLVNNGRVHKFGYRLARFRTDPKLLWEPNLTETQLAALNGLHRVYDAGKTRWVKTL